MENVDQDETKQRKLGPTASAISSALDSNIALQTELKKRLIEVRRKQLQNRTHAAEVTRSLSHCWDIESYKQLSKSMPRSDGEESQDENHASLVRETRPQMDFNPNRRWTRHFFVDANGCTPNILLGEATTTKESPGENEHGVKLPAAWSKDDVATLQRVVGETLEGYNTRKGDGASSNDGNGQSIPWKDNIFFQEIASNLNINPPRSAEECRAALLTFADENIVTAKFTKEESLFILREVSQRGEGDVDWHEITCNLNSQLYSEPKRRTPWECFRHYRSNLRDSDKKCPPWTAEEDELLLKYIAAHGPQYIFGDSAISQACQHLFPLRDPASVQLRAHKTLVNPNLVQDRWDTTEQRKLALLKRAYSDTDSGNPNSEHFQHRAQARVITKWERSLNPAVSRMPFTEAEDEKLLAAVKELGPNEGSFVSIAKQFPNRNDEALWNRWVLLADEDDVASKLSNRLMNKKLGGGKKSMLRDGDGLLSPDDFVLKKKPKSKAGS